MEFSILLGTATNRRGRCLHGSNIWGQSGEKTLDLLPQNAYHLALKACMSRKQGRVHQRRKDILCWNMSGRGSAVSSAVLCHFCCCRLYQLHKKEGLRIAMPTFDFGELSSYSNPSQTNLIRRSLVHWFIISPRLHYH